jgi:hypothetical protein
MQSLFTHDSLISLLTLCLLEIVLGIDNVIFVSLLIGRLPANRQLDARRIWVIAGILCPCHSNRSGGCAADTDITPPVRVSPALKVSFRNHLVDSTHFCGQNESELCCLHNGIC